MVTICRDKDKKRFLRSRHSLVKMSFVTNTCQAKWHEVFLLTNSIFSKGIFHMGLPDSRDIFSPLPVKGFGPLLQLVKLVLDLFYLLSISSLFCHSLQNVTPTILPKCRRQFYNTTFHELLDSFHIVWKDKWKDSNACFKTKYLNVKNILARFLMQYQNICLARFCPDIHWKYQIN